MLLARAKRRQLGVSCTIVLVAFTPVHIGLDLVMHC